MGEAGHTLTALKRVDENGRPAKRRAASVRWKHQLKKRTEEYSTGEKKPPTGLEAR